MGYAHLTGPMGEVLRGTERLVKANPIMRVQYLNRVSNEMTPHEHHFITHAIHLPSKSGEGAHRFCPANARTTLESRFRHGLLKE